MNQKRNNFDMEVRSERWGSRSLRNAEDRLMDSENRRIALCAEAAGMYRQVAGGHQDASEVRAKLMILGQAKGFSEKEAKRMIDWGERKGMVNPQHPDHLGSKADINTRREIIVKWFQSVMESDLTARAKMVGWAMGYVGIKSGQTRFDLSARQLAEIVNAPPTSVCKWSKELEGSGFLYPVNKGNKLKSESSEWQLAAFGSQVHGTFGDLSIFSKSPTRFDIEDFVAPSVFPALGYSELLDPSADIWTYQKTAWFLYHTICASFRLTNSELSELSGVGLRGMQKSLAYLLKLGLIEDEDGFKIPLTIEDELVSEYVGEERLQRRIAQHGRDREAFKVWKEERWEVLRSSKRRAEHKAAVSVLGSGHATTSATQEGPGQEGSSEAQGSGFV